MIAHRHRDMEYYIPTTFQNTRKNQITREAFKVELTSGGVTFVEEHTHNISSGVGHEAADAAASIVT